MSQNHSFVTTIPTEISDQLIQDLKVKGFDISYPAYTLFAAKKEGVSCTLYQSGKLMVQGKLKKDFIEFYLEPEILKTFAGETSVNYRPHIGVDESGKGDFFGPLCIAGVQASSSQIKYLIDIGIKDSKKISDKSVLKLADLIKKECPHSLIRISPTKYNQIYHKFLNLNYLLGWGHATVIEELVKKTDCKEVIIDQFAKEHVVLEALKKKQIKVDLLQKTKAEEDPVVAAASVLARAAFLEGLAFLSDKYNIVLPKGASEKVVQTAREIVSLHSKEVLSDVSKSHFKTSKQI
ncbi:MAG: ribonuclease HIII [Rhabdochlamydiaceae bacterium]